MASTSSSSSPIDGPFTLKIKTLSDSDTFTLDLGGDILCRELKQAIEQVRGAPCQRQRLIFGGKVLKDNKRLSEYGIRPDSVSS